MNIFLIVLRAEAIKAIAARTLWAILAITVVGVGCISATMVVAIRSGRPDLTAKLGSLGKLPDWTALIGGGTMVTAAGGLLALGVGLSWLYGREFSDGTIGALFGLPVSLGQVALAKATVFLGWAALLAAVLPVTLLVSGLAVGLGAPDSGVLAGLLREGALVLLSALLVFPCAWAVSLGRNLLTGIATAVGLLVVAQVGSLAAPTAAFPLTAPALWAADPSSANAVGLATTPLVAVAFCTLTIWTWNRLQLDR
jgi:ABC-2 type transport system permease protein